MSHPLHTRTRSALAVTAVGVVLAAAAPAYADPPDPRSGGVHVRDHL